MKLARKQVCVCVCVCVHVQACNLALEPYSLQCAGMDGDTKARMEQLLAEMIGINQNLQGILFPLTLANYTYGTKLD